MRSLCPDLGEHQWPSKREHHRSAYLIDNNHNNGSSGEGTPGLATHAATNDKICWTVASDNVNWDGDMSIQNFGTAGVFGAGSTPKLVDGKTWTGQVASD